MNNESWGVLNSPFVFLPVFFKDYLLKKIWLSITLNEK